MVGTLLLRHLLRYILLNNRLLFIFLISIVFIFISGLIDVTNPMRLIIAILVLYVIFRSPFTSVCYYLCFFYIHPGGIGVPFPFQSILFIGAISTFLMNYTRVADHVTYSMDRWLFFTVVLFVVFGLYATSSFLWAKYQSDFVSNIPILLNVSVGVLFLAYILHGIKKVDEYKFLLIFWACIASFTIINGFFHSVLFPESFIRSAIPVPDFSGVDRFEGVFRWLPPQRDPNYIATTLIMPVILAFTLLMNTKYKKIFGVMFFLGVLSIIMSFSRTSYMVIIIFLLYYLMVKNKLFKPKVVTFMCLILFSLFQVEVFVDRIESLILNISSGSGSGRSTFFSQAINLWADNVFFGVGYWQFHNYHFYAVHNTFLEVLVGLGTLGLVTFTLPVFILILFYRSTPKSMAYKGLIEGVYYGFFFYCLNLNSVSLINLFEYVSFLLIALFFLRRVRNNYNFIL